jgi:hypothetical protein
MFACEWFCDTKKDLKAGMKCVLNDRVDEPEGVLAGAVDENIMCGKYGIRFYAEPLP